MLNVLNTSMDLNITTPPQQPFSPHPPPGRIWKDPRPPVLMPICLAVLLQLLLLTCDDWFIHLFICSLIYLSINSFIRSFIHSFILIPSWRTTSVCSSVSGEDAVQGKPEQSGVMNERETDKYTLTKMHLGAHTRTHTRVATRVFIISLPESRR